MRLRVGLDTGQRPRTRHFLPAGMRNRPERTFQEQVVDVDPHVGMVEREFGRAAERESVPRRRFVHRDRSGGLPIEKDRPALLQKCEERLAIRNDLRQRPPLEHGVLAKLPNEAAFQSPRQVESAVVAAQQEAEQIRCQPDRLGREPEQAPKHECLGLRLAEATCRRLSRLGRVQGIEIAPVQGIDDRTAQLREEVAELEREVMARLQHVVGNCTQIRCVTSDRDDQIRQIAPVPV